MSSGMITIARPYALAAFEFAQSKRELASWKVMLDEAAYIVQRPDVTALIANPELSSTQLYDFFCDILLPFLDEAKKNFLRVLADNKRLNVLPEIANLFGQYYAEAEKVVEVNVTSAVALSEKYREKLTQALAKRLQKQVSMVCNVDPTVIGGALIRIGDRVIDGSVRGKLHRLLAYSLS